MIRGKGHEGSGRRNLQAGWHDPRDRDPDALQMIKTRDENTRSLSSGLRAVPCSALAGLKPDDVAKAVDDPGLLAGPGTAPWSSHARHFRCKYSNQDSTGLAKTTVDGLFRDRTFGTRFINLHGVREQISGVTRIYLCQE